MNGGKTLAAHHLRYTEKEREISVRSSRFVCDTAEWMSGKIPIFTLTTCQVIQCDHDCVMIFTTQLSHSHFCMYLFYINI